MKNIEIGTAVLRYKRDGTNDSAEFIPSTHVFKGAELTKALSSIKGDNEKEIKAGAEMVVSHWFARMVHVELSDRETSKIESEIVSCTNWSNGHPKECRIRFTFIS